MIGFFFVKKKKKTWRESNGTNRSTKVGGCLRRFRSVFRGNTPLFLSC